MLSLLRKWRKVHSNVAATVSGCCNNNHKTISHRPKSQHAWNNKAGCYNANAHLQKSRSARTFSTLETNPASKSTGLTMSKAEIREFMAVYPNVVRDLTESAVKYKSEEAAEWFNKALEYNLSLTNGKNGALTTFAYKSFVGEEQISADKLRLAHILGWCIELLHCVLFITDDVVDNSSTRRGQLCWYKLENVGLNCINDALMIENGIYELLDKHFRHLDCYMDLVELFHQNTFKCISGQSLDMIVSKRNVDTFDMDTYKSVVRNKTSSNFFYLPAAVGLRLAGVKDNEIFNECAAVTFELGNYCQALNDFLDVFGNPTFTGKIGTDIQSNKCSWLAIMCLEIASPEQKAIMQECYGQSDPQKTARIQELYEELNMPTIFAQYEEETFKKLKGRIHQTSSSALRDVLFETLNHVNLRGVK